MGNKIPNEITVMDLPNCDMCSNLGIINVAEYDAILPKNKVWTNLCKRHFDMYKCKLGLGYGQKLVLFDENEF